MLCVICGTGSQHSNPTETWATSAQASNTASQPRGSSGYMVSPHARSLNLPSSTNAATAYPMMNGGILPSHASMPQQQPQQQPHPASLQPGQGGSQLQYSLSPNALLSPMAAAAAAAANQYYLQTQGQVSYSSPIMYQKNPGMPSASYSVASHS